MKKGIIFVIVSVMLFWCVGCTGGAPSITKKEEAKSYAPLIIQNFERDEMPVMGFGSVYAGEYMKDGYVYPSIFKKETFQKVADAGVNLIIESSYNLGDYEEDEVVRKTLEWGKDAGIRFIMPDNKIFTLNQVDGSTYTLADEETIQNRISEFYDKHEEISGLYVRDEPSKSFFDSIKAINNGFLNAVSAGGGNYTTYNNMFPPTSVSQLLGNAPAPEGGYSYNKYIDDMAGCNPSFLMYDSYPFYGQDSISDSWFSTMATIRQKAQDYNLPWTLWIQAGGNFADAKQLRLNTEGEFMWSINSALAFGAKGFGYFPLGMPNYYVSGGTGSLDCALINEYGNTTPYHAYAKKISVQIKAVDAVLMNAASEGMIFTGEGCISNPSAGTIKSGTFRQLQKVSGSASIVGCFDYKGATALYVVNNQPKETSAEILLTFNGNYYYDVVQRGKLSSVSGDRLNLRLDAGEGALVVLR